jgi:hypothetical protein
MDAEGTKPRTRSSERVPRWPFGWQVLCGVSPDARKCFQSYHLAAVSPYTPHRACTAVPNPIQRPTSPNGRVC